MNTAYAINGGDPRTSTCGNGEFSDERFAFLFTPGTYTGLNVPVGYYTSVYGLGNAPTDTVFEGEKGVYCEQSCLNFESGALGTFWRSAENFHTKSNYQWEVGSGMTWAVSQAAPLRNVKVDNSLLLFEYIPESCCAAGFASGGWNSGVDVGGSVSYGSQQQFMTRSSSAGTFETPVWNGVFAGVTNPPNARCGSLNDDGSSERSSVSVEPTIPLVAEKPYIVTNDNGASFILVIPSVHADTAGVPWDASGFPDSVSVDFSDVYVTQPTDTSAIINAKLAEGLHVVISPGVYALDDSLFLQKDNQVILGLGLATLTAPPNGKPCITVGDVDGVRIAGMLLEAGKFETTGALLQVGVSGSHAGAVTNPTILSDVFARVGGNVNGVGPVDTMFLIQSGYTIIDNTWLWRADHSVDGLVYNGDNPVKNGLQVKANNVFAYGLASEHTIEDNVLWEGDNGVTFFYQAEIMYDATDDVWGYSCYTLGENVDTHTATGIGCYSYFRDAAVTAPRGIDTSSAMNVKIDKSLAVFLNGIAGSAISNTFNDDGLEVNSTQQAQYHCEA